MFNFGPAGPATKSKNRSPLFAAIAATLCCLVIAGQSHAQIAENPVTGHRYEYVRIRGFINWEQARDEAAARGGYLATITDSIESRIVGSLLAFPGTKAFLGANDYRDSCTWHWITGEPWNYENWAPGEPGGEEPCINSLRTSYELGGQWESDVSPLDGFIVEWNAPNSDTLLNLQQWPVSEGGNGHWYAYLPRTLSWDQARQAARQFHKDGVTGHLATITSQQENDFIFNNLVLHDSTNIFGRVGPHWLGGYEDSLWAWVTGEPFIYTNWGYGHPQYIDNIQGLAMLGPPAMGCPNCPQPGDWVSHPRDMLFGSIVEFDTEPTEPHVLYVPEEYPTIQLAIEAARNGDKVLVGPGVYHESINFLGKAITVRGADGPLETTITNERTANLVTFNHGESHAAALEGFTLRGGWIAILCVNSGPTIRHNICRDQNVWNWAAICLSGPLDTIVDPTGDPRYHANSGYSPAVLVNNTIVHSANGGISMFSITPPTIQNNIVAFNANYGIHQQSLNAQVMPIIGYNDVFGHGPFTGGPYGDYINIPDPGPGAISADPMFNPDFTLRAGSPCIDAGDPNPRFNDPDGSRNDMGAMPFMGGSGGGVIPTNEWIIVFCDNLRPDVVPTSQVSVIRAYDPAGVLCGEAIRYWEGSFGLMPIYRDDPYTDVDEGCEPGDLIQFKIDDVPAQSSPPVYWTANGDVFEVCDFGATHCVDIPLHAGWNLISWNVAFESEIRTALDEIIGCVDVVQSFEQGGLTFDPNLDGFNTLTHVDYHHGYWIRMNCDAVLQVCGDQIPFEEWIALEPGWNLVSYWPKQPLLIEQGFYSIMDSLQEAMGFNNGAQVWLPTTPYLNTLVELRPTFGYWAKVPGIMPLYYPAFVPFPDTLPWPWPPDSGFTEAPPLTETSRNWISVYGNNITLDGKALADGAVITFGTGDDITCGRGVYSNNILRLTPVYGLDQSGEVSKMYPKEGDMLAVYVDGERVYPDLHMSDSGARVRLSRFTTDSRGLPQTFHLEQNFPNPFNPGTKIRFDVAADTRVNLAVLNILGQKVRTLTDQDYFVGRYELQWDGRDDNGTPVSTGVYFYRLTAGETVLTKKMMLLK